MCDIGPEEAVVFYTFLPEVFALVSLLEVELDDVLVVALCVEMIIYNIFLLVGMKNRDWDGQE